MDTISIFLVVGLWLGVGISIGFWAYRLMISLHLPNRNKLNIRIGLFIAVLFGCVLPYLLLHYTDAVNSATNGWGLYTLPLSAGGTYLGYNLPQNSLKFNLLHVTWQWLIGMITLALYLAIMDINDYAFTYYPAQTLFYGLDYSAMLNQLHQANENEIKVTILYCMATTILSTLPLSVRLGSEQFLD